MAIAEHTDNAYPTTTDLEAPRQWTVDSRSERVIVLLHEAADYAIRAVATGDGQWLSDIVDPEGDARDGVDRPQETIQEAVDKAAAYVQRRRAKLRNRFEQIREANDVDWPDELGGFELDEIQSDTTTAIYTHRYIRDYSTQLGPKYRTRKLEIKLTETPNRTDKPRHWVVEHSTFGRKATAIEHAKQVLVDRREKAHEVEQKVIEQNPVKEWQIP
mgnify:CR=1 FL=1